VENYGKMCYFSNGYKGGNIMITETDKDTIIRYAKKYDVSAVYLFGSSLDEKHEAADIDIGIKGIMPRVFFNFKFYGELLRHLSKPVDIVDLSKKSLFNQIIEEKAVKIYGRTT
jgi:predicted nucleotidyltransferase